MLESSSLTAPAVYALDSDPRYVQRGFYFWQPIGLATFLAAFRHPAMRKGRL